MQRSGLKRDLSLLDLTFVGVSGTIGSGWLLASQAAAATAGPSAIVSWLVGGIAIIIVALVYAELASMLPEAGGSVRYPQYSHGSLVSFIIGWGGWLSWVATPPAEAEAITQYANNFLHTLYNDKTGLLTVSGLILSIALTIVFFLLNYFGVKLFAKVNTGITWIKFAIPISTAVLLMVFGFHSGNFVSQKGFFPHGVSATLMAVGSSGIMFSLQGFRQAVELAGEARNPKRDLPIAVILAVLISVGIYVLLQTAFIGALPSAMLSKGWSSLNLDAPFAQIAVAINLGWLAIVLQTDAMVSPLGTGLVYTASTARGILAMAENGYLPKTFLYIHPKWKIPTHALLFNLLIGILTLLPFSGWNKIIAFVSVTGVISYLLGPVAASVLRRTVPEIERPVRLPGLGILSPLAFIVAGLIIYWTGWPNTAYALGATVIGLLIYFYYYGKGNFKSRHLRSGLWLIVYLVFIIFFSYIGSKSFGGIDLIPAPYDTIAFSVISLLAFYWGQKSGYRTEEIAETSWRIANGEY